MITWSVFIGIAFGFIWGKLFSDRYKRLSSLAQSQNISTWFLASTSTIRYVLLAALLIVLIMRYNLIIYWWFAGFAPSFWTTITISRQK